MVSTAYGYALLIDICTQLVANKTRAQQTCMRVFSAISNTKQQKYMFCLFLFAFNFPIYKIENRKQTSYVFAVVLHLNVNTTDRPSIEFEHIQQQKSC